MPNGRVFSLDPEKQALFEMVQGTYAKMREIERNVAPEEIGAVRREHQLVMNHLRDLGNVLTALKGEKIGGGSGDPDVVRIENVPGRRIPFDFLTEIPINANDTSIRQGTITIDQSGPYVAQARCMTFLSQFQFQRRDPESGIIGTFLGRSNGRFRPPHSAWDVMDAFLPADTVRLVAFPGTGAPSYSSPALHSPYRTMEFDARIEVRAQSNSYPRGNIPVPSAFWTTQINAPFQLGALDWFGRNEVVDFLVQPQHVNNPPVGNLFGFGAGGVFPFADAQYDHHEGINDEEDPAVVTGDPDPVTRLPVGLVIIGFHGYRIIQPPGAVTNVGML